MSKPGLLLLHGALGSSAQLAPLSLFLENSFSLGIIDFTGHGKQTLFVNDFSFDVFMDDIYKWAGKQSREKINLFGYSMGGYAALLFAAKYPERVEKIFTLGTKLLWTPEEAERESQFLFPEKMEEKTPGFANKLKEMHGLTNWANLVNKTRTFISSMGKNAPLSKEIFKNISCRVLLGVGDKDTMARVEDTVNVYGMLPKGELLVIPNTPHPFEKVDLESLANQIIRFFNSK
jgi:pimeloyl-ACP methyl ester carboxylesterase